MQQIMVEWHLLMCADYSLFPLQPLIFFFYRSLVANSDCETSDSAVHACYLEFKSHFLVIDSEVNRTDCWNLVIRKIANF